MGRQPLTDTVRCGLRSYFDGTQEASQMVRSIAPSWLTTQRLLGRASAGKPASVPCSRSVCSQDTTGVGQRERGTSSPKNCTAALGGARPRAQPG